MQYWFHIHSRPKLDEKITDKHARLMRGLARIKGEWGLQTKRRPSVHEPGPREEFGVDVKLKGYLGPNIRGELFYASRSGLAWNLREFGNDYVDDATFDDRLLLRFDPLAVDYAALAEGVFAAYVAAFDAYYGEVYDDVFNQFEFVKFEDRVSSRHGVEYLSQMNFFDGQLCRRAFRLSPAQVVQRVKQNVHEARVVGAGALLIAGREVPTLAGAWETNARLMPLLTGKKAMVPKELKEALAEAAQREARPVKENDSTTRQQFKPVRNPARTSLGRALRAAYRFLHSAARDEEVRPKALARGLQSIADELAHCPAALRNAIQGQPKPAAQRKAIRYNAADQVRLARATIEALRFLDQLPERDMPLDTAVQGLEVIAAELDARRPDQRAHIHAALDELTSEEKAGSRRKRVLEFYDEFVESFGIEETEAMVRE